MYQITIIDPDGGTSPTIEQEGAPDHTQLAAAINNGPLELIPHFDKYGARHAVVFGDEEAKLKALPRNIKATYLWYACLAPRPHVPDVLHGPIVVITADTATELEAL